MTLRDKVVEAYFSGGSSLEAIAAIMEVLKDYEALVVGVKEIIDSMPPNDNSINGCKLRDLCKPFLPPTKLSDRLDEVIPEVYEVACPEDCQAVEEKLSEIASELKEQGL